MILEIHKAAEKYSACAGKGCRNSGNTPLAIKYINKRGIFCDACSHNLLSLGLAVRIEDLV